MEGVISYLRTAAEIKSLLAMGIKKVINLLSSKKIRVRLQPLMQHFLVEKKNDSAYLERIGDRVMAWQNKRDEGQLSAAVLLYHRTGAKALHGFRYEIIQYTKKSRPIYKTQRSQFSNNERKAWVRHIAEKNKAELLEAGITTDEINIMLSLGRSPEGYQVHHRIPLDDGGNNNFDNLILIRDDVEHRSIHGYYNPGELRIDLITEGEQGNVVLPVPPVEAVVYPNKARGFYCDDVPNSQLVELYDVD